ncbi:MAG: YihY/virulence factor BrkB family protein [Pseudomonadota bacterium]
MTAPSETVADDAPTLHWWSVARHLARKLDRDRASLISAGVTYFALLSMVPGLSALISIYGLLLDPMTLTQHLTALSDLVPADGIRLMQAQLEALINRGTEALGLAFLISVSLALWLSSRAMKAIFQALELAFEAPETRGPLKFNAMALFFTLSGMAGMVVFITATVAIPAVFAFLGATGVWTVLIRVVSFALLVVMLLAGLSALYYWGAPRRKDVRRKVLPGAIVAVVMMLVMSVAFSFYVSNFANLNQTYGSLGALIGFMTWIWLSVLAVLVGAELNAVLSRGVGDTPPIAWATLYLALPATLIAYFASRSAFRT